MPNELSWNLTQHAKIMDAQEIIPFLEEVEFYNGEVPDKEPLNESLNARGILTVNVRGDKSDTWRDYQQVLPSLGLIVSTKVQKEITITPIGKMLLERQIEYEDFITIQLLRLQYPNGNTTSKGIWIDQHEAGMRVKPGLLILETLLTLSDVNEEPYITVNECQQCLVSSYKGEVLLEELLEFRNAKSKATKNSHTTRNIQDWFKLLSKSNLFKLIKPNKLVLSDLALSNKGNLHELVNKSKDNYWIPQNFDKQDKLDWFKYIGSLPGSEYSLLPKITGFELPESDNDPKVSIPNSVSAPNKIVLGDVESSLNLNTKKFSGKSFAKSGGEKRFAAYTLHDTLIKKLSEHFNSLGFSSRADKNSVDLMVEGDSRKILFEVKTTTPRNISKQIRLAVGQVLEYKFRLEEDVDLAIVITTVLEADSPFVKFLHSLGISLVCWNEYSLEIHSADESSEPLLNQIKSI